MPVMTYAFCVLQTFHRLCKTSVSVRPLEMGEGEGKGVEGVGGTSKLIGQFLGSLTSPSLHETFVSVRPNITVKMRRNNWHFPDRKNSGRFLELHIGILQN